MIVRVYNVLSVANILKYNIPQIGFSLKVIGFSLK